MILRALESSENVVSVDWFERPTYPFERAARRGQKLLLSDKITVHRSTTINPFPVIRDKRLWTIGALKGQERKLDVWASKSSHTKVILDFHPFYIPPVEIIDREDVFYWYDLIDNFTKHNVFTGKQIEAVKRKYAWVKESAAFVTGVSQAALVDFPRSEAVPNRLLLSSRDQDKARVIGMADYDFGFTGFITDKFDVDFIARLSDLGYSTLIRGRAYHPEIARRLSKLNRVTVGGEYHESEQTAIFSRFRVGLVPYRPEKSHDESPIKLIQYLANGKPALISKAFGGIEDEFSRWVKVYDGMSDDELHSCVSLLKVESGGAALLDVVNSSKSVYWNSALSGLIARACSSSGGS
ncbi:hypothetical protein SPMU_33580 [Sphingomonas mucosissima]|uniref:Glycosyl transferases group 1 n=2 Tax=Sphingomonas mucosissima TaxID=370959 RepID=A0A245ZDI1_9SPHN|nr:hypothetical protein SPMU_33580 [Sphingomonas mucosissima]